MWSFKHGKWLMVYQMKNVFIHLWNEIMKNIFTIIIINNMINSNQKIQFKKHFSSCVLNKKNKNNLMFQHSAKFIATLFKFFIS